MSAALAPTTTPPMTPIEVVVPSFVTPLAAPAADDDDVVDVIDVANDDYGGGRGCCVLVARGGRDWCHPSVVATLSVHGVHPGDLIRCRIVCCPSQWQQLAQESIFQFHSLSRVPTVEAGR